MAVVQIPLFSQFQKDFLEPTLLLLACRFQKKNFIVDFSTSKLAEGKINLAVLNKQKLFGNPIVSKKGKLSNDPNKLYDGGALIPFGEIKGSAFLLVNEIIGGLLFSPNNPFKKII